MDRAAVAQLPRWERDILQRWGVAMLRSAPTTFADAPPGSVPSRREFSREDVLTMTAEDMGMA